jgi:hypothetical protein
MDFKGSPLVGGPGGNARLAGFRPAPAEAGGSALPFLPPLDCPATLALPERAIQASYSCVRKGLVRRSKPRTQTVDD